MARGNKEKAARFDEDRSYQKAVVAIERGYEDVPKQTAMGIFLMDAGYFPSAPFFNKYLKEKNIRQSEKIGHCRLVNVQQLRQALQNDKIGAAQNA